MPNALRIRNEADMIADMLISARKRLNRHGIALSWDVAGTAKHRHKLHDLAEAFKRRGSTGVAMSVTHCGMTSIEMP